MISQPRTTQLIHPCLPLGPGAEQLQGPHVLWGLTLDQGLKPGIQGAGINGRVLLPERRQRRPDQRNTVEEVVDG